MHKRKNVALPHLCKVEQKEFSIKIIAKTIQFMPLRFMTPKKEKTFTGSQQSMTHKIIASFTFTHR